jgi:hypothetical protein
MRLEYLVTDETNRSFVAYIVWSIFDSTKHRLKMKFLFFTIDSSDCVRKWLIDNFGPDPVTVKYP